VVTFSVVNLWLARTGLDFIDRYICPCAEQLLRVLITTHSPVLLNYVEPHQVRAVELDNEGKTQVHKLPTDAVRFFPLQAEDFEYPSDRTEQYIIIEILMFTGRSVEAQKHLYRLLFERLKDNLSIEPLDIEIILIETPSHNWGIRGVAGDELNK